MKKTILLQTALCALGSSFLVAQSSLEDDIAKSKTPIEKLSKKDAIKKHSKESNNVALDQDELSADVQDLIQEQTDRKVIQLLLEAEGLMGEATEKLEKSETGSPTIAIETEIIEKIYEAAKQKKKSKGWESQGGWQQSQQSMGSMLEMMEQMMGKQPGEGKQPGQGDQESPTGGKGSTGDTDKKNDDIAGNSDNTKEERIVPKNTTSSSRTLPKEDQADLDAYNKLLKKLKP